MKKTLGLLLTVSFVMIFALPALAQSDGGGDRPSLDTPEGRTQFVQRWDGNTNSALDGPEIDRIKADGAAGTPD